MFEKSYIKPTVNKVAKKFINVKFLTNCNEFKKFQT